MKRYKETVHSITLWSLAVFITLTKEMQWRKLAEELREVDRAENTERWIEEVADVWIVCAILWGRFNCLIGRIIMSYIEIMDEYHKIRLAVDRKMEINRERNWHINQNGVYHH